MKTIAILFIIVLVAGIGLAYSQPEDYSSLEKVPQKDNYKEKKSPQIKEKLVSKNSGRGTCLTQYAGYNAATGELLKANLITPSGRIINGEICQVWNPTFRIIIFEHMVDTSNINQSFFNSVPLPTNWWRSDMKEYW